LSKLDIDRLLHIILLIATGNDEIQKTVVRVGKRLPDREFSELGEKSNCVSLKFNQQDEESLMTNLVFAVDIENLR